MTFVFYRWRNYSLKGRRNLPEGTWGFNGLATDLALTQLHDTCNWGLVCGVISPRTRAGS